MALGSLAALTPVELVFMEKKKKSPPDGHARETSLLEEARRYSGLGMCTDWSIWASGSSRCWASRSSPSILGLHGAHSSHSAVAITSSRKPSWNPQLGSKLPAPADPTAADSGRWESLPPGCLPTAG